MLGSCVGIALYLDWMGIYPDFLSSLRYASFNVVSIASTTGYASTDYNLWPIFAPMWMLFLCSFASCSGSTGGGVDSNAAHTSGSFIAAVPVARVVAVAA